jgi:hypothetical protein
MRAVAEFDGRGGLRIFDISDPAHPVELSRFATADTNKEDPNGMWTVHNPEFQGKMLYASWYNDGVRALDLSQPAAPREIGYWVGEDAPAGAPPVNIWGVLPHGDLVLASDMNYGLYILKLER